MLIASIRPPVFHEVGGAVYPPDLKIKCTPGNQMTIYTYQLCCPPQQIGAYDVPVCPDSGVIDETYIENFLPIGLYGLAVVRVKDETSGEEVYIPVVVIPKDKEIKVVDVGKPAKVIVLDKRLGIMLEFIYDKAIAVSTDEVIVVSYIDYPEERAGQLFLPDGTLTPKAHLFKLEWELKFNDIDSMLKWAATTASIEISPSTFNELMSVSDKNEILQILVPLAVARYAIYLGHVVDFDIDLENYKVKMDIVFRAGWFEIPWDKIMKVLAGIGMGCVAGAATGFLAAGPAAALPGCITGAVAGGVATAVTVFTYEDKGVPPEVVKTIVVRNVENVMKPKIKYWMQQFRNKVIELKERGEITEQGAKELLELADRAEQDLLRTSDELTARIVKDYEEAYNKGMGDAKKEWLTYTALAGVGGLALGTILARR